MAHSVSDSTAIGQVLSVRLSLGRDGRSQENLEVREGERPGKVGWYSQRRRLSCCVQETPWTGEDDWVNLHPGLESGLAGDAG